jgi:hypothetical protein
MIPVLSSPSISILEVNMSEIKVYPAYLLNAGNGAVPDLTNAVDFPAEPSGETGGKKEESKALGIDDGAGFAASVHLPEVVFYEHIDFGGVEVRTNLNWYFVGSFWNDKISSIIVVSGTWRFYEHWHYEGRFWDLRPGYYRWVEAVGIPNDIISSFQAISF